MLFLISFLSFLFFVKGTSMKNVDFIYHNYSNLTALMKGWNNTSFHPRIYKNLYSIGKSIQDRELWVMEISAGPKNETSLPNVKLIGNIHGNEVFGRELLLHFIEYIFAEYTKDEAVTRLLDNTRLHIMPSMNPDGYESSNVGDGGFCSGGLGRENALGLDLNRNFPDYYHNNREPLQVETKAVMQWMDKIPFVLSTALHGGAMVVNYPFDTQKNFKSFSKEPSLSPDDDVFIHLAKTYADNHLVMHKGLLCDNIKENFKGGITNGAAWYSFAGSMQDYNYFKHGCMELTMEISCCKVPKVADLPGLWEQNRGALVDFALKANQGVTGLVLDKYTKKNISNATLYIVGRDMPFHSDVNGRFWRILLPGDYKISVSVDGYHNEEVSFRIEGLEKFPKLLEIDINLINSSIPIPTTSTQTSTAFTTQDIKDITENDRKYSSIDEFDGPIVGKVTSASVQWGFVKHLYVIVVLTLLM
ncbi:Peptidase [Oryctes borbonicus]|uniref:Peptidase n=1 Tax=Oryctes borbonicus TaxID=1629725 RepID=A0A0T6AZQ7_9SCAR|nr:Peptidase [Oryctes borbonicus]